MRIANEGNMRRTDLLIAGVLAWGAVLFGLGLLLAIRACGQESIAFQWPNVPDAVKYHLLWGFSSRDYVMTNTVRRQPGPITTATASRLQAGVVYHFAMQSVPAPRHVVPSFPSDYSPEIVITTAPPVFAVQVFEACDLRGPWEPLTNFYFRANPNGHFYQSKLFIPQNP